MSVIQLRPRNAKPGGSPAGDEPGPLPRATALGVTSIHPERRPCGACGDPTDEQDIGGDPLCDECGKDCTWCADCDDEVAHECGRDQLARHHHCRDIHKRVTACVCDEPCQNPFCTCGPS